MFLDFGQKSFGANKQCSLCNMFYVIGDVEDEKRHKSFCAKAKEGPSLPSLKGHRVLSTFEEEQHGDLVIEVRPQQKLHQEAISQVLQMVQIELGSSLDLGDENEIVLLYVRDKRVLGAIVTEQVHPKKLVALSNTIGTTDVEVADDGTASATAPVASATAVKATSCEKEAASASSFSSSSSSSASACSLFRPEAPTLGIKLVWVLKSHRRSGVARRLLDTSRKSFAYGSVVRKEHVAFSQPTTDGLALALSYVGKETIWAYK